MHETSTRTCHLITRGRAFLEILPTTSIVVQKGERGPGKIVEKGEELEIFLKAKRQTHDMRINLATEEFQCSKNLFILCIRSRKTGSSSVETPNSKNLSTIKCYFTGQY